LQEKVKILSEISNRFDCSKMFFIVAMTSYTPVSGNAPLDVTHLPMVDSRLFLKDDMKQLFPKQ